MSQEVLTIGGVKVSRTLRTCTNRPYCMIFDDRHLEIYYCDNKLPVKQVSVTMLALHFITNSALSYCSSQYSIHGHFLLDILITK